MDRDSWLSKNVRPAVMWMHSFTLSVIMVFRIEVDPWLMKTYAGWTGLMITTYFVRREVVKFVSRRKKS